MMPSLWTNFVLLLLILMEIFSVCCNVEFRAQAEERLLKTLFTGYNKLSRPVINSSDAVLVHFGLSIAQLVDVDEKNQMMTTNVWIKQEWQDFKLRWNPSEYMNVTSLRVPSELLWRPDIVLYNNADGDFAITHLTKAHLFYSGRIKWTPPAIYKSSCSIDVTFFPFDQQNCTMKFGSWTFDKAKIDLRPAAVIKDGNKLIVPTNEALSSSTYPTNAEVEQNHLSQGSDKQPNANTSLVTQRYLQEDQEKPKALCRSLSSQYSILQEDLAHADCPCSPPTNLSYRHTKEQPSSHSKARSLSLQYPYGQADPPQTNTQCQPGSNQYSHLHEDPSHSDGHSRSTIIQQCHENSDLTQPALSPCTGKRGNKGKRAASGPKRDSNRRQQQKVTLTPAMKLAMEGVQYIANHLRAEDADFLVKEDWKYVAMVIDRIFLWIFIIICLLGTLGLFLPPWMAGML
ncbi:neuronal acetylcholine receptor subunit alpha-4-like isoform X3 [Scyliorhinus canicula]|uniref:neuronal acetylcholine receptor subunit alpha-4-like isoform X3 n=1 Tax=Scyliorhinus canicula TaxID=7830 RepID=UPI0018F68EC4|nr:neuronal acetylcholine receptor subunit alpha-4-like isoform X3 [Scyliorhinus canicula]